MANLHVAKYRYYAGMASAPLSTSTVDVWRARRETVTKNLSSKSSLAVMASLGVLAATIKTVIGIVADLGFSELIARWAVVTVFALGCAVIAFQQSPLKKS